MKGEAPIPAEALRPLLYVAAYRAREGQGPTWSELCRAMGWSRGRGNREIRALYAYGLRWRRDVPRSLNVTPEARRAVLAELRRASIAREAR